MSHGASVLFLNGRFESSSFHAEHFTANEKYKSDPKNKVISTWLNDHISVTEPAEVTGNAFSIFNSQTLRHKYEFVAQEDIIHEFYEVKLGSKPQGLRHKMPSEASDALPALDKVQSETSDGLPAIDKVLSEVSDGFTATDKVLSEPSDAFTATDKVPSEVSDAFTAIDKVPSEASDALPATDKLLSEAPDAFTAVNKALSEVSDGFTAIDSALSEVSDGLPATESRGFASLTSFCLASQIKDLLSPLAFCRRACALLTEFSCGKLARTFENRKNSRKFLRKTRSPRHAR